MRHFSVSHAVIGIVLFSSASLVAQTRHTLRVVVADEADAVITGAKLALVDAGSAETHEAITDEAGRAAFGGVLAGHYLLKAEKAGFQSLERSVAITPETLAPLKLKLKIEVTEEVTVTARRRVQREFPEAIDVDTDALSKAPVAIGSGQLVELLSNFLEPAALNTGGVGLVVDGVEVNRLGVPNAAVDRIVVNKNPYSAEYRRPGKARIEVITNNGSRRHFEGNAGVQLGNSVFDARNAFAEEKPQTDKTLVEAGLGGPLPGRRGAFLLSVESLSDRQSRVVNAQTLTGPVIETVPKFEEDTFALGRVDLRPSDRVNLMVRYDFQRESERNSGVGGLRLPEQAVDSQELEHSLRVRANSIFSAAFANDLQVGFERSTGRDGGVADGQKIVVRGAFEGGSNQTFTSARSRELLIQDAATYFRGAHTIRFGGQGRAGFLRQSDQSNFGGTFEFADLNLFAAGIPSVFRLNQGTPEVDFSVYDVELFLQDEIRFGSSLTLMLGARYDWQSSLGDRNNVAPRLAVSFAPGEGRTVLRGGAGTFYERLSETILERTLLFDGTRTSELVIPNAAYPNPFGTAPTRRTPPSLVRLGADLETPHLFQASLSIEREIVRRLRSGRTPRSLFLAVEYSNVRGVDLFRARNVNAPLPGTGVRPDSSVLNITQIDSIAGLRSNSLAVNLTGRVWRFDGVARYAYSHSTNDVGGSPFRFPANNYDLAPEMGRADFDVAHKFNMMSVFNLPGDDLDLGAVLTIASGAPYDITTGFDDNGDTEATDRPVGVTRNTGQGPGFAQLDLRLIKKFELGRSLESVDEPSELLISLDAFNVLNRTNYEKVIGVQSSPFFALPNSARTPRSVQLSVRYRF
jgi:hypothetical protein